MAQGRLETHFGGAERFAAIARQVKSWGERQLPPALFETLSATPDAIAALHHMMRAGEPRFLAGDAPAAGPSQHELSANYGCSRRRFENGKDDRVTSIRNQD